MTHHCFSLPTIPMLGLLSWGFFLTLGEEASEDREAVEMVVPGGEAQKYWPRWRGPSGQGIARGHGYPDRWSETENILWKKKVPGRGHSSPIVWGNRIFLTTAQNEGRRGSMLCFRRSDGKLLWETFLPEKTAEHVHPKNSHASATPSTDGERVYAWFGEKGLVAMDMQGRIIWHRDLGTLDNYHGTAGSPLLWKDRIIVYQDHRGGSDGRAFVAAFDKRTGETIWRTERQATVGWGTPIAIRVGGRHEIVVNSQKRVQTYDPYTGKELWTCQGNLVEVIPTPVVGHGLVFCSSGRSGPTLAIRPGGSGDVTETHVVWKSNRGSSFIPSALLYGANLYMVNDTNSVATCYAAATGKVLWQGRMGEALKDGFSASPVAVEGKVFFTSDAGDTFVLAAGPKFQLLHVNRLAERTLASPALVEGRWYIRTQDHLIAIGN